jgi:hypothetical protein
MDAAVEFVWLALAVFFPSFLDFYIRGSHVPVGVFVTETPTCRR